jgi:hypothetical protein
MSARAGLDYMGTKIIWACRAPGPDRDDRDGTSMLKVSRQGGQGRPKQIRIPNDEMTKTNTLKIRCFCHWSILISVIVSDFVLRISNF